MPVQKDFRIVDDFYLWEAYQGINNGRTITQFRIVDNYYLYLVILILATTVAGIDTSKKGITATGVDQAGARQLTEDYNRVDIVAAGTGVKLDVGANNKKRVIANNGANDLNVYPFLGNNYLGEAANVPVVLPPGTSMEVFWFQGDTQWTLTS